MSAIDLENFPTSDAAKRMLSYISEEFYEKSYVGKWLLEIMGREWDKVFSLFEDELPLQFFPETATWGLKYHEKKWQLPQREDLSYEDRRKLIYEKRDSSVPMTPYQMELYVRKVTGVEIHVVDCNDPGEYGYIPDHPNMFKVFLDTEESENVTKVKSIIDRIKQSHSKIDTLEMLVQSIGNIYLGTGMATVRYNDTITF